MKPSSRCGGFRGVERHRSRFRAFHRKGLARTTIGICDTVEAAARAYDEYIVARKGIVRAFDELNFKTPALTAAYDEAVEAVTLKARVEADRQDQVFRSAVIHPSRFGELQQSFHCGVSIGDLARRHGVCEDAVKQTLRRLETERLGQLGLEPSPSVPLTRDGLVNGILRAVESGSSVRSVASSLGLDRKWVSALLKGRGP